MIEGNDGGAKVSTNGGRSWSSEDNQPTAELYRVTVDEQHPYWLYGGQQDNSTVAIPSRSDSRGIARQDWYTPGGCESGDVAVDPRDPDVTYAGCYGGTIERFDRATGRGEQVMAWPQLAVGRAAKDLEFRFQWNAPIRISPHDPAVLYHTSNHVHRSTDGGRSWQVVSPDLTRDDETKQGSAGGPISKDNTGIEVYGTIFAFEESPLVAGPAVGRQRRRPGARLRRRRCHLARRDAGGDARVGHGERHRAVAPRPAARLPRRPPLPARRLPALRLPHHRRRGRWTLLTDGKNGIPADHPVRVVREDPERQGLLYAGTEFGLYVSFDDGAHWRSLQLDLPVTPVTDLGVHDGDLVVATQGRSYWILDDLGPLRQWRPEVAAEPAHLYTPDDVVLYPGAGGGSRGEGDNPPRGAVVYYRLADDLSADGADAGGGDEVSRVDADGEGAHDVEPEGGVLRGRS